MQMEPSDVDEGTKGRRNDERRIAWKVGASVVLANNPLDIIDLRWLIAQRLSVRVAASQACHSGITERIYIHLFDEQLVDDLVRDVAQRAWLATSGKTAP
jgi:hypothetical protein